MEVLDQQTPGAGEGFGIAVKGMCSPFRRSTRRERACRCRENWCCRRRQYDALQYRIRHHHQSGQQRGRRDRDGTGGFVTRASSGGEACRLPVSPVHNTQFVTVRGGSGHDRGGARRGCGPAVTKRDEDHAQDVKSRYMDPDPFHFFILQPSIAGRSSCKSHGAGFSPHREPEANFVH